VAQKIAANLTALGAIDLYGTEVIPRVRDLLDTPTTGGDDD
jgi:hypothetical protein